MMERPSEKAMRLSDSKFMAINHLQAAITMIEHGPKFRGQTPMVREMKRILSRAYLK